MGEQADPTAGGHAEAVQHRRRPGHGVDGFLICKRAVTVDPVDGNVAGSTAGPARNSVREQISRIHGVQLTGGGAAG